MITGNYNIYIYICEHVHILCALVLARSKYMFSVIFSKWKRHYWLKVKPKLVLYRYPVIYVIYHIYEVISVAYKHISFYPRPVLAFGYCHRLRLWVCVSVCVCVDHGLVRTITHWLFKLGSPNLDQRCKTPWFRSLLFLGMIDYELQGQIQLERQILPNYELVCTITHQPFKVESPNLNRKCILALSRYLSILDLIGFDLHFHFQSWSLFF